VVDNDLFSTVGETSSSPVYTEPLAALCRPRDLDDFLGHESLKTNPIVRQILGGTLTTNLILWGPPGVGKTSFVRLLRERTTRHFVEFSASESKVSDFKKLISEAQRPGHPGFLLFVDEIHRLSKVQQDSLLQAVEDGRLMLVGTTTENPAYTLSRALLSRSIVVELRALKSSDLKDLLGKALRRYAGNRAVLDTLNHMQMDQSLEHIAHLSGGDARRALLILDCVLGLDAQLLTDVERLKVDLKTFLPQARFEALDDERHYRLISDYIKAMRASDEAKALDRLAKLLMAGEDPLFVSRRLLIFAAEDVGMASSHLQAYVVAVHQAVQAVGMPEARILLAAATLAASRARKSREAYDKIEEAWNNSERESF
jgi:putative ATPase